MGVSGARLSGLRARLARFRADERGTGTVFALFMLFVVLMLGGLAVDANNLWRYNEIMKSTADVAAHAGAVTLAEGGSAGAAEAAARKALELNMPEARYGRILAQPYRDVRAVHYDAESGTLTPGAAANAVMVRVSRSAATHNPIPTMLLRLGGFTGWDISKESMAAVLPTERCQGNDGIYAGGVLIPGPGLIVGTGYCLHSQQKVVPNPGSRFAEGAGLSMPDLARCGEICRDGTSDGVGQAAFEANLIRGDLPAMIGTIDVGFADPRHPGPGETTFFAARPMPADRQMLMPLNEVGVPLKGLTTGKIVSLSPMAFTRMRAIPQGLVYQVLCSPGPDGKLPLGAESGTLTLGGGKRPNFYRNMVLITDCALDIGAGAEVQGALIISMHNGPGIAVNADPSARIGEPAGNCSPTTRTTIMASGSIVLPAGVMSANVGLVTGGDIHITAAPASGPVIYGLIGVGMHAAGAVTLAVPHDLEACPGAADAFTPAIEVIRQVLPVTG